MPKFNEIYCSKHRIFDNVEGLIDLVQLQQKRLYSNRDKIMIGPVN